MAAVDFFLHLEGIPGESQDAKHKGEIDVVSWSWGETNAGHATGHATGGGSGSGRVVMQDFHFVMKVNKATPKLMLACADGEHLKSATLICRKSGTERQEYLKIHMSDVLVTSYQTGGSGHGDVIPVDQFSLGFAKIEYEYKEQKADGALGGSVKAGWDLKQNKKV